MHGYLAVTSPLLPADTGTIDHLVRLFTIEKVFYELRYELDHRPDWVWVPLRGISEIVRDTLQRQKKTLQFRPL